MGLCQPKNDDWVAVQQGQWSTVISAYEVTYIDVKVKYQGPGSMTPVRINIEEGYCPLNFTAIDDLMGVTALNCMASFAPQLGNLVCCPQLQATVHVLIGQSSKESGMLALDATDAEYCWSDVEQMLRFEGASYDLQKICSIHHSNLTQGSCPVKDIKEFESIVDSLKLLSACKKVDAVDECRNPICQNAIFEAARNISLRDHGLSDNITSKTLPEHSSRMNDCRDIVLRWLSSRINPPRHANNILREISNCKVNQVCPFTFPSLSNIVAQCGNAIKNHKSCCHSVRNYMSHLQNRSFINNVQALNCASSLGFQLQKMNVSMDIYSSCHITLNNFSLPVSSQGELYKLLSIQESGCLLSSLPSDVVLDPSVGMSFGCDIKDIPAPWPCSLSPQSSSFCNQTDQMPALPAAAASAEIADQMPALPTAATSAEIANQMPTLLVAATSAEIDLSHEGLVLQFVPTPHVGYSCQRVRVTGMSRLNLNYYATLLHIKLALEEPLHARTDVFVHRNSSIGLCQSKIDDWAAVDRGRRSTVWSTVISPYEEVYVDVKVMDQGPGSMTPIRITVEEEFQQWRLIWLGLGLLLPLLAPGISTSVMFYFCISLSALWFLQAVLLIVFQLVKLLPMWRKNILYITLYGSVLGVGLSIPLYFLRVLDFIFLSFGLSDEMNYPVALLLFLFINISGASFGYWLVTKHVISNDGSIDAGVAQFVKWAIRILNVVFFLLSSSDRLLSVIAWGLYSCIYLSSNKWCRQARLQLKYPENGNSWQPSSRIHTEFMCRPYKEYGRNVQKSSSSPYDETPNFSTLRQMSAIFQQEV